MQDPLNEANNQTFIDESEYKFNATVMKQDHEAMNMKHPRINWATASGHPLDPQHLISSGHNSNSHWTFAPYDLVETATAFHITCDLPGVTAEDLDVKIDNSVLHVRALKSEDPELTTQETYLQSQRSFGRVHRKIQLPTNIDPCGGSHYTFTDGVLVLNFPKLVDSTTFKKLIPIDTGEISEKKKTSDGDDLQFIV